MPATIRVQSGISTGSTYWIDRPVLRIGSDPQCEICLPSAELAPHAVTLEFRDGNYRAYNRSTAPVTLGAQLIQPGASGAWRADETAHLPGDVRLVLEVDGDPRPTPRAAAHLDDELASADLTALRETSDSSTATGSARPKKKSGTLLQLAVIGLCALASIWFLTQGSGEDAAAQNRPTFDAIVTAALAKDAADPAREILPRLQYAQAAVVRGHTDLARQRFLKLRDHLVRQLDSLPTDQRPIPNAMLRYVEYQLGQLQ